MEALGNFRIQFCLSFSSISTLYLLVPVECLGTSSFIALFLVSFHASFTVASSLIALNVHFGIVFDNLLYSDACIVTRLHRHICNVVTSTLWTCSDWIDDCMILSIWHYRNSQVSVSMLIVSCHKNKLFRTRFSQIIKTTNIIIF